MHHFRQQSRASFYNGLGIYAFRTGYLTDEIKAGLKISFPVLVCTGLCSTRGVLDMQGQHKLQTDS